MVSTVRNWLDVIAGWSEARRTPLWLQFFALWVAEALFFNAVQWLAGNDNTGQHLQVT